MKHRSSLTDQDYKYVFEELLDMSDDGFILVDRSGIVTAINESYAKFLGKPLTNILGRHITEIISNTEMVNIMENDRREVNVVDIIDQLETNYDAKDKISSITRSPVKNADRHIIGGVAQVKFRTQTLFQAKIIDDFFRALRDYYLKKNKENRLESVIGSSPSFAEAKTRALRAGSNSFSVLITGDTGTGKEVMADLIHGVGNRAEHPMVKINCAAIPPELFESELFGYERGAFTGAQTGGKKGKLELADKGTVMLDEIGDLPLNMQAKLLRVLQDGIIEPIGSVKSIPVDIRIISATNANLEEMIQKKQFRQDLYYRLNEIRINLPRLSERKSDIIPLAQHALDKLNWEFETHIAFSPEVLDYFLHYPWPGNIRELNNVVKSAYSHTDNDIIEECHLPEHLVMTSCIDEVSFHNTLEEYLNLCEKNYITRMLKKNKGNRTKTAESLGIHRSNLYKKLDKYGINEL